MKHDKKTVEDLLRDLPAVRAPADFEAKLEARLAAEAAKKKSPSLAPRLQGLRRWPTAIFTYRIPAWAAALPILLVVILFRFGPAPDKGRAGLGLTAVDQFAWMFYPDEAHLSASIELLEENARNHPDDPALPLKLIELYERQLRTADAAAAEEIRAKLDAARQRVRELVRW
jgi:hypothetical protein